MVCVYCGEDHESVKPFEDSPGIYFDACDECAFSMIEEEIKEKMMQEQEETESRSQRLLDEYNEFLHDQLRDNEWLAG